MQQKWRCCLEKGEVVFGSLAVFEVQVVVGVFFLESVYKYTNACIISSTSLQELNMKIETHFVKTKKPRLDPRDGT